MSRMRNYTRYCRRAEDMLMLFLVIQMWNELVRHANSELADFSVIGKPAAQSKSGDTGYHFIYTAENAIDGSTSTFSHTEDNDPHPWWRVDLGMQHCLGKITVILRKDCCGEGRFTATVARAGVSPNLTENQPCGAPATRAQSYTGATVGFLCDPPRLARYVTLDIDASSPDVTYAILQLAEVTMKEYTTGECTVITTENPAPQTYAGLSANSAYFKMLHKRGLIGNSNPLSTKVAKSLLRCARYCNKHTHCISFDFAPKSSQCHLYNLGSTDIEMKPSDDFSVYVLVK